MATLNRRTLIALAGTALLAARPLLAAGRPILSVRNAAGVNTDFDHDGLAALPQDGYAIETPWTEGRHAYAGPLLKTVLAAASATEGTSVTLTALNDYAIAIPMSDVTEHKLLLAMTADGVAMSVREKGPLWLLYPLGDEPGLNVPEYHARMIWQVRSIAVS